MIQRLVVFAIVLAISVALGIRELRQYRSAPLVLPEKGFVLTVAQGNSFQTVVNTLYKSGILKWPKLVLIYARWTGLDQRIKPGEYLLLQKSSIGSLLGLLQSGNVIQYQVTLPEGITLRRRSMFSPCKIHWKKYWMAPTTRDCLNWSSPTNILRGYFSRQLSVYAGGHGPEHPAARSLRDDHPT
ncbi:MAG: endolytic transglycosylase MltG [Halioglobus sp.]